MDKQFVSMARLRRGSGESYEGNAGSALQRNGEGHAAARLNGSRTRTSPRKKAVKAYTDDVEFDDEEALRLAPKNAKQSLQRSKQIRLTPLNTLASRTAGLELDLSTKLYGPPRFGIQRSTIRKEGTLTQRKSAQSPSTSTAAGDQSNQVEEEDVEESVLCDSDASSSDTSDELPSLRKFMHVKPRIRNEEQRLERTRPTNLAKALGSLRISGPVAAGNGLGCSSIEFPSSRPASSSDKENYDRHVLRLSPPRLPGSPRKQSSPERPQTPPPTSPSKGRLQSPSKKTARVPTPPLRQSLDAFWDAETVNEWNDQYSPKKDWKSPRKLRLVHEDASTSPTTSPRKPPQSPSKRTKAEMAAKKSWETRKNEIAETFLAELDRTITDHQIQQLATSTGGVRFIWSKTLKSTAGRANWKRETTRTRQSDGTTTVSHKHHASIELAEKVIDDESRLLNVVAHEFCHLCNFMISGVKDQPHGKSFRVWGRLVTDAFGHRGVEVTTKHSYRIEYKYVWRCEDEDCGTEFKRHSRSIDPARHTCGTCRSRLVQIKPVPRKVEGGGGGYAAFVKEHFKEVKKGMPGEGHKEVMEALGRKYREQKKDAETERQKGSTLAGSKKLGLSSSSTSEVELVESDAARPGFDEVDDVDKVARVLEFVVLDD